MVSFEVTHAYAFRDLRFLVFFDRMLLPVCLRVLELLRAALHRSIRVRLHTAEAFLQGLLVRYVIPDVVLDSAASLRPLLGQMFLALLLH